MNFNNFILSKKFSYLLLSLGLIIFVCLVFFSGVLVGVQKARFSYQYGENYYQNFAPQASILPPPGMSDDFRNPHGVAGNVISRSGSTLVIKDTLNREIGITVTPQTVVNLGRARIPVRDIQLNDQVVVLGEPDRAGTIVAQLIRIFRSVL